MLRLLEMAYAVDIEPSGKRRPRRKQVWRLGVLTKTSRSF